jgi:cysteine rich repeat protein
MIVLAIVSFLVAAAEHPCLADAERLCKGVEPGGGRIVRCLQQHEAELSPGCKQNRDGFREQVAEVRAACQDDAERFCNGVMPGHGKVARCLRMHTSDLSSSCKKEMADAQRRIESTRSAVEKIQEACRADEAKLCPEVELGGGGMQKCLKSHEKQLTPACSRAIAESRRDR